MTVWVFCMLIADDEVLDHSASALTTGSDGTVKQIARNGAVRFAVYSHVKIEHRFRYI